MIYWFRFIFILLVSGSVAQTSNGWTYIGPKSDAYQFKGLFTSVWADTDLNNVITGSAGGGLFITTNGLSEKPTWINITENLPYMNFGVSGIVVKKNTENKSIYISTHTGGGIVTQGFGNGILHTEDGGTSWEHVGPNGKNDYEFPLYGLVANSEDQNEMIAFDHTKLYVTHNSWQTFDSVKLPFHYEVDKVEIIEVVYAPFEKGKIYVTTRTYLNNRAQLFVSIDNGKNWKDITPSDVMCERLAISTINNEKFIGKFYMAYGNTTIYVKYFNGSLFSEPLNAIPVQHLGASSFWCLELKVNDVDTSVMYLSLTETSRSIDGGKSFNKIGTYNGSNTHADVRDMILPKSSKGGKYDRLMLANDGGISISKDFNGLNNVAFRSLNGEGLNANQFWGIDVLQSDTLFIAGGTQDNGGFFMKKNKEGNDLFSCGDGYYGLVLNDTMALMEGNPPNFLLYNIAHDGSSYIGIGDANFEARRPLILKDSFVYVGYHDLWRAKVSDVIASSFKFRNVSNLSKKIDPKKGIQNRELKAAAISKSNKALIGYVGPNWDAEKNEGKLYYCSDLLSEKPEFIDISEIAGNRLVSLCRWYQVESLVADEENENVFYMIYKDIASSANSDVYRFIYYPDSNKAQLTLMNYNLKRVGFNKLKVDKQTNSLYVASCDGIFCIRLDGNDTVWKNLNFFPKVMVSDIVFNYYTNSIYAATFGRGVWGGQIPSFTRTHKTIKGNIKENEFVKVDGILTIAAGKTYEINSKLIITSNSKIELHRKSKLIIGPKCKIVGENNEPINLNDHIVKHKTAQFIYNK